jgi:hypothetical protein
VRPTLVLEPAAHARGELEEVRLVLGREQPCANEEVDQDWHNARQLDISKRMMKHRAHRARNSA